MSSELVRPWCDCLKPQYGNRRRGNLKLHEEVQDEECEAWVLLQWLIEQARLDGRKRFAPRQEMSAQQWTQIVTLPPSIGTLKEVEELHLYSSHLVRLPPEIGGMTNLKEFTPYTSYRLHWFPYEITRCKKLVESTVSTRALYGNYKYWPPFPRLPADPVPGEDSGMVEAEAGKIMRCSVCDREFSAANLHQVWITLRVATDWMPLLVNACSKECVGNLPPPAVGYVDHPHKGGLDLVQPQNEDGMWEDVLNRKKEKGFISRWFLGGK